MALSSIWRWSSLFLSAAAISGCANGFVAGGPSFDSGTVDVAGVKSGVGLQVETGTFKRDGGEGPGTALVAGVLGFYGDADGDPIFVTLLDWRYRNHIGSGSQSARPFYTIGAGPGAAWDVAPSRLVLSVMAEAGVEIGDGPTILTVSIRERPAALFFEQTEFLNSFGMFLALSFGDRRGPTSSK